MWTREEIKSKAKADLKGKWWKSFWIIVIFLAIAGIFPGYVYVQNYDPNLAITEFVKNVTPGSSITGIIWSILITMPLGIGVTYFFLKMTSSPVRFKDMFMPFGKSYVNVMLIQLLRAIYVSLWMLLLIIPGIVKVYEYNMVSFILADNPDIDHKEAFRLSKEMTYGHKMDMFVLDLSFIGWQILGAFALGVGTFFVESYRATTYAELYLILKQKVAGSKKELSEQN